MTAHFVHLLDQLQRRSLRMASFVEDMIQEAGEAVFAADEALARRVIARDEEVDDQEVLVEAEVIRLMALYQPVGPDLRLLCTILKVNNDLERVADCAVNIAERARHLDADVIASHGAGLRQMEPIVRRMLRNAIQAYAAQERDAGAAVHADEASVDALYGQFIQGIVNQATRQPEQMAGMLDLLSVAKNLERIADHAHNITEDTVFLVTGDIVRHGRGPDV